MKNISAGLLAHFQSDVQTVCTLWTITLNNGTIKYFTDHDVDVPYGGITFLAAAGYNASNVKTDASMAVSNMEVSGFLLTPYIDKDLLLSGAFEHARVVIQYVNWADLTQGPLETKTGTLGNANIGRDMVTMELRGLTQELQRNIGELTSLSCRYDLGDTRCAKSLTAYTATGATISVVTNQHQFTTNLASFTVQLTPLTTGAPTANYFQGGKLTWLTGLNAGTISEVDTYAAGVVTIVRDCYFAITTSDTFTVIAGCNKIHKTADGVYNGDCGVKFGNVINFGGEPEMAGEKSLAVGGQ